jgi:hypothetical protein
MAIAVTAYEFWGDPTGDTTTVSQYRTAVSDLSLKALTDPTKLYYPYDIQRPPHCTPVDVIGQSFQRYIAFRITGSYTKLKNLKIVIHKPNLYQKGLDALYAAVTEETPTKLMYKLTNTYEKPKTWLNYYGNLNGLYDGTMNNILGDEVVHPRLSPISPMLATSRPVESINAPSYWTEFLVFQAQCYPDTFDKVGTFGKTGGTVQLPGGIDGPLLSVTVDEVGYATVD